MRGSGPPARRKLDHCEHPYKRNPTPTDSTLRACVSESGGSSTSSVMEPTRLCPAGTDSRRTRRIDE